MSWEKWEPSPRDLLIDRVRRGQMTPIDAEDEATRLGCGPLATKPSPIEFDPDRMPWWSVPMAVAWIAWRTTASVQEHCAEFRDKWLIWVAGSWNVPTGDGNEFTRIDGHELKTVGPTTVCRLSLSETYLKSIEELPDTTRMSIAEAQKQLLTTLAEGRLVAVAKNASGQIVDIPKREWPYLELYVEGQSDVLKHDALESPAAFSEIKLARDDLKGLWPEDLIELYMIEPMTRSGEAGYVPLCVVLHWIITEAGQKRVRLNDLIAWKASVATLLPFVETGQVEVIGRPRSGGSPKPIDGYVFAGIAVPPPLEVSFELICGDNPWISCTPYIDAEHHNHSFNDQLFLDRAADASYSHIQVKKADVLKHISFGTTDSEASKTRDPLVANKAPSAALQQKIRKAVSELWPNGHLPGRGKDRDKAIVKWFTSKGETPPSARTIRRALQ